MRAHCHIVQGVGPGLHHTTAAALIYPNRRVAGLESVERTRLAVGSGRPLVLLGVVPMAETQMTGFSPRSSDLSSPESHLTRRCGE